MEPNHQGMKKEKVERGKTGMKQVEAADQATGEDMAAIQVHVQLAVGAEEEDPHTFQVTPAAQNVHPFLLKMQILFQEILECHHH